jgi:DNA invertase Pin-like site-specific DNA recombinase
MMQMVGAFVEFEREMFRERTKAGCRGASPRSPPNKKESAEAVSSGHKTSAEIARLFKIHWATVSQMLAQARLGVWAVLSA